VNAVDSPADDRAGVNARARVVPKIGPQKSRGDVIAGVSLIASDNSGKVECKSSISASWKPPGRSVVKE